VSNTDPTPIGPRMERERAARERWERQRACAHADAQWELRHASLQRRCPTCGRYLAYRMPLEAHAVRGGLIRQGRCTALMMSPGSRDVPTAGQVVPLVTIGRCGWIAWLRVLTVTERTVADLTDADATAAGFVTHDGLLAECRRVAPWSPVVRWITFRLVTAEEGAPNE
jgi:hypothetical protein